jgi:pyruvate,water dikinase
MSHPTPLPPPRNFPVTWEDPADAARYWVADLHHNAYPRVPLRAAVAGPGLPGRQLLINGYAYFDRTDGSVPPPVADFDPHSDPMALWEQTRPEAEALAAPLKDFPVDAVSLEALREHALSLQEHALAQFWALHRRLLTTARHASQAFDAFCDDTGITSEERETLLSGVDSLALRSSRQQWELGRLAAGEPAVLDVLVDHRPGEVEPHLRALGDVAETLLEGVKAHVREFGWRVAEQHPYARPVVDDRAPVWDTVRSAARGEMADPYERHTAVARRREAATAGVRGRLPAARQAVFDRLYPRALAFPLIFEDHNVVMDQVMAAVQARLCHRLATRLHATGLVPDTRDAYFLERDELAALDLERAGPALQATLAERRATWERWCTYTPPVALGSRPPSADAFRDGFWGEVHETDGDARVLRGSPASAGTATGTARVLRDMGEADRLAAGDILVCITTLPPWTSLFARIGGVVTVGGGMISHAAITAREYGIPAVLSVADATTRIKDGQRVTVDGTNGVVRLED